MITPFNAEEATRKSKHHREERDNVYWEILKACREGETFCIMHLSEFMLTELLGKGYEVDTYAWGQVIKWGDNLNNI